ncbi:MAG TPA: hypothetical protein VEA38_07135 [Terriglobales bacterium]|nr:hypothetical protein [Terriglobales bacterium]
MANLTVTRDAVLAAIRECDALGQKAFLAKYGYRPSLRWVLYYEGRAYPSKAILGVAAGRSAREFFGGAAHTVITLKRLGFQLQRFGTRHAAAVLAASALGFVAVQPVNLQSEPVAYFASGSNHAGEIRGFAAIDHDVGVAAPEVNAAAEEALIELAGTDVQVFVDSGAFSEVAFGPEGVRVVKPMTHDDWVRYLALCRRLALSLGDQLHIVAPDRVGDQSVTLERLATYAPVLRELYDLGVHVLVPVQKGALTQAAFAAKVDEILGDLRWVPAIPMKKAATTVAELEAFLQARQPRQLHLLGVGPRSEVAPEAFAAIKMLAPECLFTCDSVLIKAFVGRSRKQNQFTAARDTVLRIFGAEIADTVALCKELTTVLAFGPLTAGGAA